MASTKNENQTEKWFSKPKALLYELFFATHMVQFIKNGAPETTAIRFFQPYEIVYDREGAIIENKFETLWYTYNRSIVLWISGKDFPSSRWG